MLTCEGWVPLGTDGSYAFAPTGLRYCTAQLLFYREDGLVIDGPSGTLYVPDRWSGPHPWVEKWDLSDPDQYLVREIDDLIAMRERGAAVGLEQCEAEHRDSGMADGDETLEECRIRVTAELDLVPYLEMLRDHPDQVLGR